MVEGLTVKGNNFPFLGRNFSIVCSGVPRKSSLAGFEQPSPASFQLAYLVEEHRGLCLRIIPTSKLGAGFAYALAPFRFARCHRRGDRSRKPQRGGEAEMAQGNGWLDGVAGKLGPMSKTPLGPPPVLSDVYAGIIGQSQQLREVLAKIDKVAAGDANVCIMGESGTGKELIARAIHHNSPRRDRPLVTLDCTAVPEGLMESHLFGHRRGSFTGAVEHRNGVFSLADTGTLFIDEISELPLTLQAKLLRVIQAHEFVKVGGSKPIRTDIRLITASNKDLREAVADGSFRADLYYRIAVVMIQLPPLRERRDDIPRLVEHFLEKFSTVHRKPIPARTPQPLEILTSYSWPGNVRQLENCIEQALVLADDETIDVDVLSLDEHEPRKASGAVPSAPLGLTLREVEQEHILRTLRAVDGSRTRAAKILGISLRCLQYKLKSYAEEGAEHLEPFGGSQTNYPL